MISGEIRQSTRNLAGAMAICADKLNKSIVGVGQAVRQGTQQITGALNENTKVTQALLSAQELNNSLQRKSNATMEQLLSDYRLVNSR